MSKTACLYPSRHTALAVVSIQVGAAADATLSCGRACLEAFINGYLDAMLARNPYSLPLDSRVKFTENEQEIALGEGIWGTASALGTYKLYVSDPESGQAGFLGTLRENGNPVAFALRLTIEHGLIREVETIVVRDPGTAQAIEALGRPDPLFTTALPKAERRTRTQMIAIAGKYSDGIEHSKGLWFRSIRRGTVSRIACKPPTIPA